MMTVFVGVDADIQGVDAETDNDYTCHYEIQGNTPWYTYDTTNDTLGGPESWIMLLFHLINNRYTCYQHHFCTKFLLHTSCLMNLKVPHNVMTVWRVVFSFRLIFILSIHFSIILVSVTSCCLSRWTKKNVTLIGPPTQIIWGKCSIIWWHQRNYRM